MLYKSPIGSDHVKWFGATRATPLLLRDNIKFIFIPNTERLTLYNLC